MLRARRARLEDERARQVDDLKFLAAAMGARFDRVGPSDDATGDASGIARAPSITSIAQFLGTSVKRVRASTH